MNSNQNSRVPANTLTEGQVFRPNADKRFTATWMVVVRRHSDKAFTSIDYTIVGDHSGFVGRFQTASLATMEVQS